MLYNPKVSIVIPAYNASNYLSEAIDSALAQDYNKIEIVVVNDGSKDDGKTRDVALSYGDKIKYFEKENGGSSSALNVGISNMTGEWFSWLSHDDLYYKNKISQQVALMNEMLSSGVGEDALCKTAFFSPADIIDSKGVIIKKANARKSQKHLQIFENEDANGHLISYPIQVGFYGCSCLIHRSTFDTIGGFDEKKHLLNDLDMWFRLYANGYSIKYIPKALVMERIHSGQVSRTIGYSYHNPEQDDFWKESLEWLEANRSNDKELFLNYAKIAYKKTRYDDGAKAFDVATKIDSSLKMKISAYKAFLKVESQLINFAKRIYFLVRT
ncbi:MAG: glycosyltransferase [Oscillospiraceae bacterium]|nr:glycosyltransferase [Oscillospiraceae bacterium]